MTTTGNETQRENVIEVDAEVYEPTNSGRRDAHTGFTPTPEQLAAHQARVKKITVGLWVGFAIVALLFVVFLKVAITLVGAVLSFIFKNPLAALAIVAAIYIVTRGRSAFAMAARRGGR